MIRNSIRQSFVVWLLVCMIAASPCLCFATENKKIVVKGSTSMESLVRSWAKQFMKENKGVNIDVEAKGSKVGIRMLGLKKADIAMSSRRIRPPEAEALRQKGIKVVDTPVAIEGIAIVVNKENPLDEIRFDQLGELFGGEYKTWDKLGGPHEPIELFIRSVSKSGTATIIYENILLQRPFSKAAKVNDYYEKNLGEVSKRRWAITFSPFNKAEKADVKILAIRMSGDSPPLKPTEENFKKRAYPLSRTFHLYHDASAPESVKKFVEFCWNHGLGAM